MLKKTLCIGMASLALVAVFSLPAYSDDAYSRCSVSLWSPIQIAPEESDVRGFRLNLLYGENRQVHGLDLGVVNVSTMGLTGVQMGGLNWDHGEMYGLQFGVDNVFQGTADSGSSARAAANSGAHGVQLGGLNIVFPEGQLTGAQIGVINIAKHMEGLQLGVINIAEQMRGVQIGALNFLPNGSVAFMPILNASF